jgi:hypothetical protein
MAVKMVMAKVELLTKLEEVPEGNAAYMRGQDDSVRTLRELPSYELHRRVEEMYDHLMMVETGDGEWEELGENAARDGGFKRYRSIPVKNDTANMECTVTVVENLALRFFTP